MEKTEQLYEGKAKKVWATDDPEIVMTKIFTSLITKMTQLHLTALKKVLLQARVL